MRVRRGRAGDGIVITLNQRQYERFSDLVEDACTPAVTVDIECEDFDGESYSLIITGGYWRVFEAVANALPWVDDSDDAATE